MATTILEISAKSRHFSINPKFLFVLFFLVIAFVKSAADPASINNNPSSKMASDSAGLLNSSADFAASKTRKREKYPPDEPKGRKNDQFVAGDKHEVPSGPNPISN